MHKKKGKKWKREKTSFVACKSTHTHTEHIEFIYSTAPLPSTYIIPVSVCIMT